MATSFQLLQFNENEYFYLSYEDSDEPIYDQRHPENFQSLLQKAFKKEDYTIDSNTIETKEIITDDKFSESYAVELSKQIKNIKQLDYFVNERIEKLNQSLLVTGDSSSNQALFRCKVCGHQSNKLSNVKYHIERHHFKGLQIQCSFCNTIFEQQRGVYNMSIQIRKHELRHSVDFYQGL